MYNPDDELDDDQVPRPQVMAAPAVAVPQKLPPAIDVAPIAQQTQADVQKLNTLKNSPSGIDALKANHPIARGILKGLDIAGSVLFPGFTQNIPGTQLHHNELVNRQQGVVNNDMADVDKAEQGNYTAAHTDAILNPPIKPKEESWSISPDGRHKVEKNSGQVVPLDDAVSKSATTPQAGYAAAIADAINNGRDPMTDPHVMAWKSGLDSIAKQEKPDSPEQQFIDEYKTSHKGSTAAAAVSAYSAATQKPEREPKQLGVSPDGTVVELRPGSKMPAGTKSMSGYEKGPTADEQRRSDLANNMNENLSQLEDILKRRPDLFGPIAGRMTHVRQLTGTSDPDVAALKTIEEQMGMAMVGAHAMRNAQHVEKAASSILNGFKNEPAAMAGSIAAAKASLQTFINDANKANGAAPAAAHPSSDGMINVQIPGHKPGKILATAKGQFLKDHPDGQVLP